MSGSAVTMVEGEAKSFLTSKTFWANVIVTPAAVWLASHNLVLDAQSQAEIVVVFIGLMNLVLRKLTTVPVTLSLPKTGNTPPTPPIAKTLGALLLLCLFFALTACTPPTSKPQTSYTPTPAQVIYQANSDYIIALDLSDAYVQLPLCGSPGATVICKQESIVLLLQAGSAKVQAAISLATAAIAAKQDPTTLIGNIQTALTDLQTLTASLPKQA